LTSKSSDVDCDGADEVLYTGASPRLYPTDRRLVLYVPRTRQSYALRIENRTGGKHPSRITISPNARASTANAYRAALQQRAQSL
jgi:hypothetical protein